MTTTITTKQSKQKVMESETKPKDRSEPLTVPLADLLKTKQKLNDNKLNKLNEIGGSYGL
jgi:hypothetical protein